MIMNGEIKQTSTAAPAETMAFTPDETAAFLRVIGRVEAAVSTDETRPAIHGLELAVRGGVDTRITAPFAVYAWATDGARMHIATAGDVREVVATYEANAYGEARKAFTRLGHGGGFRFFRLVGADVGRFTDALRKARAQGFGASLSFLRFDQSAGPRTGETVLHVVELDGGSGWREERVRTCTRPVSETPHLKVIVPQGYTCEAEVIVERKSFLENAATAAKRNRKGENGRPDSCGVALALAYGSTALSVEGAFLDAALRREPVCTRSQIVGGSAYMGPPSAAGPWGVDARYLSDALRAAMPHKMESLLGNKRAGAVTFRLYGDLDPIVIRQGDARDTAPGEDGESPETFVALVMPMRI